MRKLLVLSLTILVAGCSSGTSYWSQFGGGPGISFASKKNLGSNISQVWDLGYKRQLSMVWPVIDDEHAYAVVDNPDESYSSCLVRISLESGEQDMDLLPIGKGTSFAMVVDKYWMIISEGPKVTKYDKKTFEKIWDFQLDDDENIFQFACIEDIVFMATDKGNMYCLNKDTGMARWQQKADENYFYRWCASNGETSLIEGYSSDGNGMMKIMAFDSYTGDYKWQFETDGDASIPPQISGQKVIVNSNGQIALLDMNTGELKWSQLIRNASGLPTKIDKPGCFLEEVYYLVNGNHLVGYEIETGTVIDEIIVPIDSPVAGMVASRNSIFLSYFGNKYLICYDIYSKKFSKIIEGDRTVLGMAALNGLVVQTIESILYFK